MRGRRVLTTAALLVAAACAQNAGMPVTQGAMNPRALDPNEGEAPRPARRAESRIPLGDGLALPAAQRILTLPSDQRYRFVPPDSLVGGTTTEDVRSASQTASLRTAMSVVLHSRGWRESEDSADFDIAIFFSRRTQMRSEVREERVVSTEASHLPRCDASRGGNQPRCTNEREPAVRRVSVSVPYTTTRMYHIIRRRSDGAVRFWAHTAVDMEQVKGIVARDLLETLLTPEG